MLYDKRMTIRNNESEITADIGQFLAIFSEKIKNGKYDKYFDIYYKRCNIHAKNYIKSQIDAPMKKIYGFPKFLPVNKNKVTIAMDATNSMEVIDESIAIDATEEKDGNDKEDSDDDNEEDIENEKENIDEIRTTKSLCGFLY